MTTLNAWKMAGVVFVLCVATAIAAQAQVFTNLVEFDQTNGGNPSGALVQGIDGNLYGTTTYGGTTQAAGTIFKITPGGTLTTMYDFDAYDGGDPWAGLTLSTDGNFYGTTSLGGNGYGTVFKMTPAGTVTTIYSFCPTYVCSDGSQPLGTLVQGVDGNFYGTTFTGGDLGSCFAHGCGTVFKITPDGELTILHTFGSTEGWFPRSGLVQGADGNFYGTTSQGSGGTCNGNLGCGEVFKITPTGSLTTLYSFATGVLGYSPYAGLLQASDGKFYGSTSSGGLGDCYGGCGTLFRITPKGTLTTFHSLESETGALPWATMIQATDGKLYGTTQWAGNDGDVFQVSQTGKVIAVPGFAQTDGNIVYGGLVQATSGVFYGTTSGGGMSGCSGLYGCGTVYSMDLGLAPFVAFVRSYGRVGQIGGILAQGFTGTTSVSFNGIPASFTVVSDTFLKATVPAGASTGYVTVVTPSGTLTSNVKFRVIK